MRIFNAIFLILLAVFILSPVSQAEVGLSVEGTPKVVLPEAKFDYGRVVAGTKVEHDFLLKNSGTAPLKIEQVHTSCGCTAAVLDSAVIAPGAETKVRTTFDTAGFDGKKIKTIRLYSNDPQNSSFLFTLEGSVHPEVHIDPPRIFFGDIIKGKEKTVGTNILIATEEDLAASNALYNLAPTGTEVAAPQTKKEVKEIQITDATSKSPYLDIALEPLDSSVKAKGKRLNITLKSSAPVGLLRDRVTIRTTSSRVPVVNVGVFARVQGDLLISPNSISFGLLEAPVSSDNIQIVRIENSSTAKVVSVTSVESDNPAVIPVLVSEPGKAQSEIRVSVKPGLIGAFRATITVYTDNQDPDQKKLSIPVYGIVARKGS